MLFTKFVLAKGQIRTDGVDIYCITFQSEKNDTSLEESTFGFLLLATIEHGQLYCEVSIHLSNSAIWSLDYVISNFSRFKRVCKARKPKNKNKQ